jgi:hypothetical protein
MMARDVPDKSPLEGYRRLSFMVIDRDVVYVSPSTVYRVLAKAGRLMRTNASPPARARASFSRSLPTSTGTSTSRT